MTLPSGAGGFLVRSVEKATVVDRAESGHASTLEFALRCVAYWQLPGASGIITGEPAQIQGLRRGPHLARTAGVRLVERSAFLRVRMPAPDVVRLTVVAGRPWTEFDDSADWGMLVDAEPVGIALHVDPAQDATHVVPALAGGTGEAAASTTSERPYVVTPAGDSTTGVVIDSTPFRLQIEGPRGERLLAGAGEICQAMGAALTPTIGFGPGWVSCSFALAPGELLAGLGEQAGPSTRNGQQLMVAVDDPMGTGTGGTYKAAPVLHSSAGYSIFVHTPGPLAVDAGATFCDVLTLRVPGNRFDLFVLTGPTLAGRLERYTELTGRPGAVPRWALGVWMSRCRYQDRRELLHAARGMREHGVGCDVVHLDPSWLVRDVLNCDFLWNHERFGEPAELVAELGRLGLRLSLWELPYLDPTSPLAAEAAAAGLLVRDRNGRPAEVARTFSRDGRARWLVDFTNPAAAVWWAGCHQSLLDAGVATFTTDFGEGLPDDAAPAANEPGDDTLWRNLYPLWYNRTVSETIAAHCGGPAVVLGRSGWAGSQRYPGQWSGDATSSPAGMAATIRAGLSWALSAPGMWTHDIGGFYGGDPEHGPSPALYVRWAQFGCLSPLTRFHGLTPREPWEFGSQALDIVRRFVALRYELLPYLESAMLAATRYGLPVMRPMALEMEDDPAAWHADCQYLLGDDLLVAPVASEEHGPVAVSVLVPPGSWVDLFTGVRSPGPTRIHRRVPLDRLPLLVRAGAVLPMGPPATSTVDLPRGRWTLHLWPGPERSTTVLDPAGACRYRPADHRGRPAATPGDLAAVVVEHEPERRAEAAVCHLPDGSTRPLDLLR